jgi:RNA polymerase-binding transcription factor DksA
MHPILFRFGPVAIFSFGLMLAIAVLILSFIVWKKARQNALSDEKVIDIFILSLFSLVVFGRAIHVFFNWPFFQNDWGRIFLLLKYPGISFGGGLVASVTVIIALSILNRINPWLLLDIFSAAFSVAIIFGFGGCYLDGCMRSSVPLFPLTMAGVSLAIIVLLWLLGRKIKSSTVLSTKLHRRPGLVFLSYLQFISISFLILSKASGGINLWPFVLVFVVSFVVFVVRYWQLIKMIKFPNDVLTQVKGYLEARRNEIEKKMSEMKKEDPFEDKTRLLDRASDDSEAQSKAGHERVAALSRQLSMALVETRKALTKIKLGKYGICENCGKMIDTDRLAAMPTATLCLSCEKKKERK